MQRVQQLVAELDQVAWLGAQEGNDHIASDSHLVRVLGPKEPTEGSRKARVGQAAEDGRRELARAVPGDDGVNHGFEGGLGGTHRSEIP